MHNRCNRFTRPLTLSSRLHDDADFVIFVATFMWRRITQDVDA